MIGNGCEWANLDILIKNNAPIRRSAYPFGVGHSPAPVRSSYGGGDLKERTYEISDKNIGWHIRFTSGIISFFAENVRRENTGLHATVYMIYRDVMEAEPKVIGYDTFNLQRADPRNKLCRDAYKQVGNIFKAEYSQLAMQNDFTMFCIGLEEAMLSNSNAEELDGNEDPQAPPYILNPYVIESAGTILYGPPGRGKSYMAILMAISIDAGHNGFWPIRQKKAMFVNLERSRASVRDRIGMINRRLGLDPRRPLLTLNARGKSLVEVKSRCHYAVMKKNVEIMILDSISRTGYGALNEDKTANTIIDTLSSICQSWIGIAHTPRADETHVFGSMHFEGGMDVGVQMLSQAEDTKLGVGLKITKNNYGKLIREPDIIAFEFGDYLLVDIRRAEAGEFAEIEASRERGMLGRIRDYISDMDTKKASAGEIAEALEMDRSRVSRILKNEKHFVNLGRTEGDRKIYYGIKSDQVE